tara:strand:- start:5303 stop:5635 length:333 start_codon:yes stop_codon:yes gene_type:complete
MAKPRQGLVERFKRWFNIDHLVDLSVDLFLLLFDVLSSPVLIVMRLIRFTLSNFFADSIKKYIKRIIHWIEKKPRWVKAILIPVTIVGIFAVMIFLILFEMFFDVLEEEE